MQVSWQQSYSTRSRVQDVRLRYRSRLQSYQRGRPVTSWSRAWYYAIKMAPNIQLTTGRDREIAGFDIVVSLKTKFKRHILEEFHGYSWAFCPGHC